MSAVPQLLPQPTPALRRIVITGAGRGIGLAVAARALARGIDVFAGCRGDTRALQQVADGTPGRLVVLDLDVTDEASLARSVQAVRTWTDHVDLLVNNAGIHSRSADIGAADRSMAFGELSAEGILRMVHVNAVGPGLVTQAFADLLGVGARVINVTSRKGSMAWQTTGGNYGYCASKAAANMITRTLAADLRPRGVTVVAVHPGTVRTDMGGPDAAYSPDACADRLLALARRLTLADTGRFFRPDGTDHPW